MPAAMLMEAVLSSDSMDQRTLETLGVLPLLQLELKNVGGIEDFNDNNNNNNNDDDRNKESGGEYTGEGEEVNKKRNNGAENYGDTSKDIKYCKIIDNDKCRPASPFEDAIGIFFETMTNKGSEKSIKGPYLDHISQTAVGCCTTLALRMFDLLANKWQLAESVSLPKVSPPCPIQLLRYSPITQGLTIAKENFARQALYLMAVNTDSCLRGDNNDKILVELLEMELDRKFRPSLGISTRTTKSSDIIPIYRLDDINALSLRHNHRVLFPESRIESVDGFVGTTIIVKDLKFALGMIVRLCTIQSALKAFDEVLSCGAVSNFKENINEYCTRTLPSVCSFDNEISTLGPAWSKLHSSLTYGTVTNAGTDFDLRGRCFFYFSVPSWIINDFVDLRLIGIIDKAPVSQREVGTREGLGSMLRSRAISLFFNASNTEFILVLDLMNLLVIRTDMGNSTERGSILCGVNMQNILTVVSEENRLHIMIRRTNDIVPIIKNGTCPRCSI